MYRQRTKTLNGALVSQEVTAGIPGSRRHSSCLHQVSRTSSSRLCRQRSRQEPLEILCVSPGEVRSHLVAQSLLLFGKSSVTKFNKNFFSFFPQWELLFFQSSRRFLRIPLRPLLAALEWGAPLWISSNFGRATGDYSTRTVILNGAPAVFLRPASFAGRGGRGVKDLLHCAARLSHICFFLAQPTTRVVHRYAPSSTLRASRRPWRIPGIDAIAPSPGCTPTPVMLSVARPDSGRAESKHPYGTHALMVKTTRCFWLEACCLKLVAEFRDGYQLMCTQLAASDKPLAASQDNALPLA